MVTTTAYLTVNHREEWTVESESRCRKFSSPLQLKPSMALPVVNA